MSKPYGEWTARTTFVCERCHRPIWIRYKYHGTCIHCTCAIFPSYVKPLRKDQLPPKVKSYWFGDKAWYKLKRWDEWYTHQFLMVINHDPELVYEIGSEELIARRHDKASYKKMISAPKRIKSVGFVCKHCKVRFING